MEPTYRTDEQAWTDDDWQRDFEAREEIARHA